MVTDICKDEIIYTDTWEKEDADIDKCIEKYNNSGKRFLFYPWGIFITSYSRLHLWNAILEFGPDYLYSDTDSIKCINYEKHLPFVEKYNRWCHKKVQIMCKAMNLNPDDLNPKTIKGEPKPIGVWDHETKNDPYIAFKSLGAKRYLVKQKDGYHMTVAGVNKKVAMPYLVEKYGDDVFKAFSIGLHLPKGTTGKLTHVYVDIPQTGQIFDYMGNSYTFHDEPPGVFLEPTEYDFSISEDYYKFLKGVNITK